MYHTAVDNQSKGLVHLSSPLNCGLFEVEVESNSSVHLKFPTRGLAQNKSIYIFCVHNAIVHGPNWLELGLC